MSVYQTDFTHTDRQISVRMHILFVDQHTAGTVHGFYSIVFVIDNCCIHVVFVVFPVTASVPQISVQDDRSGNFYIACFFVDLSPVIQQCVFSTIPLGRKKGKPGPSSSIVNSFSSLPNFLWSRFSLLRSLSGKLPVRMPSDKMYRRYGTAFCSFHCLSSKHLQRMSV